METKSLAGLFPDEILGAVGLRQKFRAKQIYEWICRGASTFGEMTNISKSEREELSRSASIFSSSVTNTLRDDDGTVKLQIELSDGMRVEAVLLADKAGRKTACVSSQAGCAMGCAFCQTGRLGLGRNLSAQEIVEEFLHMEREAGRLDNIVFMGMGEPLQNLAAVQRAAQVLTDKNGRNLSARRITLSTCGIARGIYELAESPVPMRLALSLTTADERLREELMPSARANPLPELRKALAHYAQKTGKRITLEAVLLSGRNMDGEGAKKLAEFARGLGAFVNLIPWNEIPGMEFKRPSKPECERFLGLLEAEGVRAQLRFPRGGGISGACGQLGKSRRD